MIRSSVILWVTLIILSTTVRGQISSGKIVDKESGSPLSFVNIGIINKDIGVVSTDLGMYTIDISNATDLDTLKFSYVGFEPYKISVYDIKREGTEYDVELIRAKYRLKEVVISSDSWTSKELGVQRKKCYPIPLFKKATSHIGFPRNGYEHEIGTLFKNDLITYLDSIRFNFAKSSIDTLDLRINIYAQKDGVFYSVLKDPLYLYTCHLISMESQVVDLSHLGIIVEGDFLIAIENYKRIEKNAFKILCNFKREGRKYPTYQRNNTESKWVNLKFKKRDFGLSFVAYVKQ